MKRQEDIEKKPQDKQNHQEKSKTLRQVVYQCLKESDYKTLDELIMMRSTREIEKFYEKEASSLLHLALTVTSFRPETLHYLLNKIPQQLSCEVLKSREFSFLRAYIHVYTTAKESGEFGKQWEDQMVEKLKILSNIDDIGVKGFFQEKLPLH